MKSKLTFFLLALGLFAAGGAADALLDGAPQCPEPWGVQAYPHPTDCNSFFLCTNGTLSYERCENGLLFDGKGAVHNHCNYHWAVDCGNKQVDIVPLSSPGCEYQFGIYPDSDHCSTGYIKCAYGEPHQAQCDAGLVYDAKSHTCVWPDQLIPFCNPEEVIGFRCPSSPPTGAAARFWPFPRFPVPGDCGRLITCVEGHPRLITCGEDKLFDSETLSCLDRDELPHW
ncbi:hypothetical protein TKK_0017319 [Trichogramma kaykai]